MSIGNHFPDIELLQRALELGADPNEITDSGSTWVSFLLFVDQASSAPRGLEKTDRVAQEMLLRAVRLLLNGGASPVIPAPLLARTGSLGWLKWQWEEYVKISGGSWDRMPLQLVSVADYLVLLRPQYLLTARTLQDCIALASLKLAEKVAANNARLAIRAGIKSVQASPEGQWNFRAAMSPLPETAESAEFTTYHSEKVRQFEPALDMLKRSNIYENSDMYGIYPPEFPTGLYADHSSTPFYTINDRAWTVTIYYLNSDAVVKELMDRKSASTSERPNWIEANNIMTNCWNVLFLQASDQRWKHQRKITHSELTSPARADAGLPFMYYETAKFIYETSIDQDAGTDQQNLWAQIGRYTYSTFALQTLGLEIKSTDDPNIDYIHDSGLEYIKATIPGSYIVDTFPFLQKLPLSLKPWERKGRELFLDNLKWSIKLKNVSNLSQMGQRIELTVVQQLMSGGSTAPNAKETMLYRILTDEKRLGFGSEEEAAYLNLMLIQGAADTSKMSTMSFLEAMMTFPDVQRKAQEEIDSVVGDRVPVWEDLQNLPYVRCMMKEVWRWRPPVALGHPHVTTRDLEYKGMLIPKGSRLHINAWAIQHDPSRHEHPDAFWPERYADDHATAQQSINSPNVADRDHFAFGSGRRICPGVHVAERSLSLSIMRILWSFNVVVAPRAKLPLNPMDFPGAMFGNPGPQLPACLVVRSAEKKKLIEKNWEEERIRYENSKVRQA
ncbi:hypothetical protein E8E14_000798 [Neopestalotiopsis sp. 37M]|nr:hypothetical protein E8E14_000798 [Neopestalotiopsis sp. 37M]